MIWNRPDRGPLRDGDSRDKTPTGVSRCSTENSWQREPSFTIVSQVPRYTTFPKAQQPKHSTKTQGSNWDPDRPIVQFNDRKETLMRHEYKRGMIFNAPIHEEDMQSNRPTAHPECRSLSAFGPVFTKTRYLIVVALHTTHCICVPLYTHEDKGLAGKEHYRHEFCFIRDGRIAIKDFKPLSSYKPLVTDSKGPRINPLSTVWFTRPVSRRYELSIGSCGSLTDNSTANLCSLVHREQSRALGVIGEE